MEPSQSGPRTTLKEKLLSLLQVGATGVVLVSTTVDIPSTSSGSAADAESRHSIEQRVKDLRRQILAEPGVEDASAGAENLLAWYNWHNWNNGWHNGWHNWHNWRNW